MSERLKDFVPYPIEQHQARLICADPVAQAWEWISRYAQNLTDQVQESREGDEGVSIAELIETANSHQEDSNNRWGGEYITRGGVFEGASVDPTFWVKYAIATGRELKNVQQNSFFGCSC